MSRVYILGGAQTDFARNMTREGLALFDLFQEVLLTGMEQVEISARELEVGHVGNFVGDLYNGQAHLGGFFSHADSGFVGMPASRHEAACASGSMALLAAMADIESGRYRTAAVLGIELMRSVTGDALVEHLRPAAWADKEAVDTPLVWPALFDRIRQQYADQYDLPDEALVAIAKKNFSNAQRNPYAQTRAWQMTEEHFGDDEQLNPRVYGGIRRHDCGQITDGAVVLFLANAATAAEYAKKHNRSLASLPYIKGWGHRTSYLALEPKLSRADEERRSGSVLFPHLQQTFQDALRRADMLNIHAVDGLEVHDCFNMTEYLAVDHCGLTPPGRSWQAILSGKTQMDGCLPINASGGLMGLGHPVGATGVRMVLDAYRQTTGTANDCQIEGAKNIQTLNVGGSLTTAVSFVVGVDG